MSKIDNALDQQGDDKLFSEMDKLKAENARLKAKQAKREKWIERDEKLANKIRIGRLVTKNDLDDPAFAKKYPDARIGDEFNDPEPLLWKVGFKKRPTLEQTHAQVAAQFARDFRDDILGEDNAEDFLDDFDVSDDEFTHAEVQAFLHEASRQDAQQPPPPAEQSPEGANGDEVTDKPSDATSDPSQSEE